MNEAQQLIEELKLYGASQVLIAKMLHTTTVNISRIVHGERSGNWTLPRLRLLVTQVRQAREEQARKQQPRAVVVSQPAPAPVRPQVVESNLVQIAQQITALPRPSVPQVKRLFLPQRAASQQVPEVSPEVLLNPIAYAAYYRPESWPIGVPVYPPPELKVRLAWPRTPERWDQ
jgi:hypothetical protein